MQLLICAQALFMMQTTCSSVRTRLAQPTSISPEKSVSSMQASNRLKACRQASTVAGLLVSCPRSGCRVRVGKPQVNSSNVYCRSHFLSSPSRTVVEQLWRSVSCAHLPQCGASDSHVALVAPPEPHAPRAKNKCNNSHFGPPARVSSARTPMAMALTSAPRSLTPLSSRLSTRSVKGAPLGPLGRTNRRRDFCSVTER